MYLALENGLWYLKWILDIADLAKTMQPQALTKLDVTFNSLAIKKSTCQVTSGVNELRLQAMIKYY